jgi:protein SCO1/2
VLVPAAVRGVASVVVVGMAFTACSKVADPSPDVTGTPAAILRPAPSDFYGTSVAAVRRPELTLRDTDGSRFALADRPVDEVTVVFFGYTHCPDVCPTTMADLAAARRQLPATVRDRVTVVFVTEDPARDTPRVLRSWLDRMDPAFVGLRGGNDKTQRVLDELYLPQSRRVTAPTPAVVHPQDGHEHPGEYEIEHSGIVYAFGPDGNTVIYSGGTTPRQYADDFTRLAAGA